MTCTKSLVNKSKRRRGKDDSESSQLESEPSPKRPRVHKEKPSTPRRSKRQTSTKITENIKQFLYILFYSK